jgi:hypothetical protein
MVIIYNIIKFALIWWLISKGLLYYDKTASFDTQNVIGALLLILPCIIGYERIISDIANGILKSYFKNSDDAVSENKPKLTFQEKLQKLMD